MASINSKYNRDIAATYVELRTAVLGNNPDDAKRILEEQNDDQTSKKLLEIQDDEHGETILLQACRSRYLTPMVALLFSQIRRIGQNEYLKRQLRLKSNNGSTALMLITRFSPSHEMIEKFVEATVHYLGAGFLKEQLDAKTIHGYTALGLACSNETITTETVLLLSSWLAQFDLCDQQLKAVRYFGTRTVRKSEEEIDNVYAQQLHHQQNASRDQFHQSKGTATNNGDPCKKTGISAECEALETVVIADFPDVDQIKKVFQQSEDAVKLVDATVSCYRESTGILTHALAHNASETVITTLVEEIRKAAGDESLKRHLLHRDDHQRPSLLYAASFSTSPSIFRLFAEKIEQIAGKSVLNAMLDADMNSSIYQLHVELYKRVVEPKYYPKKNSAEVLSFLASPLRKAICLNDHSAIMSTFSRDGAEKLLFKKRSVDDQNSNSSGSSSSCCSVLEQALRDQRGAQIGSVKFPEVTIETFNLLFQEIVRIGGDDNGDTFIKAQLDGIQEAHQNSSPGEKNSLLYHAYYHCSLHDVFLLVISKILDQADGRRQLMDHVSQIDIALDPKNNRSDRFRLLCSLYSYFGLFGQAVSKLRKKRGEHVVAKIFVPDVVRRIETRFGSSIEYYYDYDGELETAIDTALREISAGAAQSMSSLKAAAKRSSDAKKRSERETDQSGTLI